LNEIVIEQIHHPEILNETITFNIDIHNPVLIVRRKRKVKGLVKDESQYEIWNMQDLEQIKELYPKWSIQDYGVYENIEDIDYLIGGDVGLKRSWIRFVKS